MSDRERSYFGYRADENRNGLIFREAEGVSRLGFLSQLKICSAFNQKMMPILLILTG
jgi:hypothetical protein